MNLREELKTSLDEAEKVWVKNVKTGNVYQVLKKTAENNKKYESPSDEEIKQNKDKEIVSSRNKLSKTTINSTLNNINNVKKSIADIDNKDSRKRALKVAKLMEKYLSATDDKKALIVQEMVDNRLLQVNTQNPEIATKKIYMSPETGLYRKAFGDKNALSSDFHRIINKYDLNVDVRSNSADRRLSALKGQFNEVGVAQHLTGDHKDRYDEITKNLQDVGGDAKKLDSYNKKVAESIKKKLPPNAEIKEAIVTKKTDRYDPTDLTVVYEVDGVEKKMKISQKMYSNTNSITMKNAGMLSAGSNFVRGDEGKELDEKAQKFWNEFNYTKETNEKKRNAKKVQLRKAYIDNIADSLDTLSKTEEGQKQLAQLWKDVHGADRDVWTSIVNSNNGETELYPPDYYSVPKEPFKITNNGKKIVVEMDTVDNMRLEIDLKTEAKKTPVLTFKAVRPQKNIKEYFVGLWIDKILNEIFKEADKNIKLYLN